MSGRGRSVFLLAMACTTASLLLAADAAYAQETPALTPTPPRFLIGGGLDGFLRDGSRSMLQPTLHAGYELRLPRGRMTGVRLGLDYTTRYAGPTTTTLINGASAVENAQSVHSQVFGAVALATYRFTRGDAYPYGLLGGGVYGLRIVRHESPSAYSPGLDERGTRFSPALSGGFGLSVPIGSNAIFGEARLTYLSNGTGGDRPGVRSVVIPLVVGLRF